MIIVISYYVFAEQMTMIKKLANTKIFYFVIIFLALIANNVTPQNKGDVVFSISFGFASKGNFSIKYFPIDRYALEIHGGAIPHSLLNGMAFHYYFDVDRPNTFIQLGIVNFMGFNLVDFDSTETDTLVS